MIRFILCALVILTQCGFAFPNGWNVGPIAPSSIIYPIYSNGPATTNQTLTAGQSGQTVVMTGAVNNTQFFLPTASIGLEYSFIDDTTKFIAVIPQSTDTIQIAATVQGTGIQNSTSTAIGNSITLICRSPNTWSILNQSGTWATGN